MPDVKLFKLASTGEVSISEALSLDEMMGSNVMFSGGAISSALCERLLICCSIGGSKELSIGFEGLRPSVNLTLIFGFWR